MERDVFARRSRARSAARVVVILVVLAAVGWMVGVAAGRGAAALLRARAVGETPRSVGAAPGTVVRAAALRTTDGGDGDVEPSIGGLGPCGSEIDQDTTLLKTFGAPPHELPSLRDDDAMRRLRRAPDDPLLQRIAIARGVLWENALAYRVEIDGGVARIPPWAGDWRYARVVHPVTGRAFDAVHWKDVDDAHATLYFEAGTTNVCGIGE